jgi:uncharacterized membrane protein
MPLPFVAWSLVAMTLICLLPVVLSQSRKRKLAAYASDDATEEVKQQVKKQKKRV